MSTLFRPIPSAPDHYASMEGEIVSATCGVLKPWVGTKSGHLYVTIKTDTYRKRRSVHSLMLEAFKGPRPTGLEGMHADGNAGHNHLINLGYGTRSQQRLDDVANGVHPQARKTKCPAGHTYTPENTRIYQGRRYCKQCRIDYDKGRKRV